MMDLPLLKVDRPLLVNFEASILKCALPCDAPHPSAKIIIFTAYLFSLSL
jgi:hypothetical protein